MEDARGKVDTSPTDDTLSLSPHADVTTGLSYDGSLTFVNGVVTLDAARAVETNTPGTLYLTASAVASDGTTDTAVTTAKSKTFKVTA